jgi:hypothetical protein
MVDLIVSVDDVATELQLAAADIAIEQQLPNPATNQQVEAITVLTDQLVSGDQARLPDALVAGLDAEEQVAILSEVRDKVAEIWRDFSEWRKATFAQASDKLRSVAEKTLQTAAKLGVSVEHLIGRLQRRITAGLVQNAVLSPFSIGTGSELVTFVPAEVKVTSTLKSAPSVASLDISGVVSLLSGILSIELDVEVKYGARK